MLPDDVLLEIQWRRVVFGSSRRLNLQLVCSTETPARDTPNIWPPLPLLVYVDESETSGVDSVVAALDRSDCVREISITISRSQSEELWKAMEESFPELTFLDLESNNEHHHVCDHLLYCNVSYRLLVAHYFLLLLATFATPS
jgi:hypothetical protein